MNVCAMFTRTCVDGGLKYNFYYKNEKVSSLPPSKQGRLHVYTLLLGIFYIQSL